MTNRIATILIMLTACTATLSTTAVTAPIKYVWNVSESVPVGLYRLTPISKLYVPELVTLRPPEPLATFLNEAGYLPRGIPILKHILALAGQVVCRTGATITVDGIAVGKAREHDNRYRFLPVWQGCQIIADGDVFLMNPQSANSLDGRYFGVLPVTSIFAEAQLVWSVGKR